MMIRQFFLTSLELPYSLKSIVGLPSNQYFKSRIENTIYIERERERDREKESKRKEGGFKKLFGHSFIFKRKEERERNSNSLRRVINNRNHQSIRIPIIRPPTRAWYSLDHLCICNPKLLLSLTQ